MSNDKRRWIEGIVFLVAFGLTIPAANWMIGNVGTFCAPNGPCLIPVAPHLMAPSGVLMIGIALVLRDLVQRRLGVAYSASAVVIGAILSALVAPPSLVLASGAGRAARWSVGTAVAGGMLFATFLNIIFIPVLYVVIQSMRHPATPPGAGESHAVRTGEEPANA